MKQGDLAIMVVRQLADAYKIFDNAEVTVKVGDTYMSDNVPCNVYETAVASLGHHPWPYIKKYLEVQLLSEPVPVVRNDVMYSLVDKVQVMREIPLEELRQNPEFDAACVANEKKHEEFQIWFENEMEEIKKRREEKERLFESRYKKMKVVALLPAIFVVIFYLLIPLCLSWLGLL